MIFKLTFIGHLKMLRDLLFTTVIYAGFFLWIAAEVKAEILFAMIVGYILIYILPVAIIHLNHWQSNRGNVYVIDEKGIRMNGNKNSVDIKKEDISQITFYMSAKKMQDSGLVHLPFERYFYGTIKSVNGECIVLTCLLSNQIHKNIHSILQGVEIKYVNGFYSLVKERN